jgi:hypothetical protein
MHRTLLPEKMCIWNPLTGHATPLQDTACELLEVSICAHAFAIRAAGSAISIEVWHFALMYGSEGGCPQIIHNVFIPCASVCLLLQSVQLPKNQQRYSSCCLHSHHFSRYICDTSNGCTWPATVLNLSGLICLRQSLAPSAKQVHVDCHRHSWSHNDEHHSRHVMEESLLTTSRAC